MVGAVTLKQKKKKESNVASKWSNLSACMAYKNKVNFK